MNERLLNYLIRGLMRIKDQRSWERIFQLSLGKMNFGNGGNFNQSGELIVAELVREKFKEGPLITIFDVGANNGGYAKALSTLFGPQARIFSFEPSKKTFEQLLKTTEGLANVFPKMIGFGHEEQHEFLYSDAEGSGLASVYKRRLDHFGIGMDRVEEIELTTIDRFCSDNGVDRIHFLKLDIEGHELSALKGADRMIQAGKIDLIQFEFGGCNIDSRTYLQDYFYLLQDNYKLYRILKDGIHELGVYKETYEIFITVNYLAIKK